MGESAARLSIAPGGGFGAGLLQITGLSVQYKIFADRLLTPIDLCRCGVELSAGVCGTKETPSCVPTACPASGPGQCVPGYGSNSIATAYDGFIGREEGYMMSIQQDMQQIATHAIEVDLGATMKVCGIQLYWDASDQYAQVWRVSASTGGSSYDLLAEAGPNGQVEGRDVEVISGPPAWDTHTAGQVAQNDYGLKCVNARRVRLEMEDSESDLFFKLLEFKVLSGAVMTCSCRHGGVCLDDGGCTCPAAAHPTCVKPECGWGGNSCALASCVAGVSCNNYATCTGPNTCTCRLGWHGTTGAEQCITPSCGDGSVTSSAQGGRETCDDGNLINGDGCSAVCQVEAIAPRRLPAPMAVGTGLYIPRADIHDVVVSQQSVATALMNRCINYGEQCLRFEPGPLELCDPSVRIGEQCLVVDQQIMSHAEVCTKDGRELFQGFTGCAEAGGLEEVKFFFEKLSCAQVCYNGGECLSISETCQCRPGWEGDDCSISQCERGCDHGGTCVGVNDCGECGAGWTGEYCGTAEGVLATLTVCLAAVVCLALACAIVLTCCRMRWIPIKVLTQDSLCVFIRSNRFQYY